MASIETRADSEGTKSYRVKIRLRGYPLQTATFLRLTDAKRWATQTEAAIREGRHFKDVEAKRHTLGSAIERYFRECLPKLKDSKNRGRLLEWWKREFGAFLLSDLTLTRIIEARDKLTSTPRVSQKKKPDPNAPLQYRTPASVNRYLSALGPVLTACVKEWQWMDSNPMDKVTKGKESRGRVRFLSDDERKALLDACKKATDTPELRIVVLLAITTGARRGEISGLRWRQVDLSRRVIVLEDSKNGERRALPLAGPALETVIEWSKERSQNPDALVFPGRLDTTKPLDFERAWQTALKRAELEDFRFHDLRHSTASYLAMNGASLAEIAEVLGHKTLQMVKRYSHLSHEHTASVITRMAAKIFEDNE
ncbi:MAG: site-specific integrase [Gammaproteobacteria bacterium]|jgi:integrase|nr:site-specific integrase [Gammaproteobacteria bacterium]